MSDAGFLFEIKTTKVIERKSEEQQISEYVQRTSPDRT